MSSPNLIFEKNQGYCSVFFHTFRRFLPQDDPKEKSCRLEKYPKFGSLVRRVFRQNIEMSYRSKAVSDYGGINFFSHHIPNFSIFFQMLF